MLDLIRVGKRLLRGIRQDVSGIQGDDFRLFGRNKVQDHLPVGEEVYFDQAVSDLDDVALCELLLVPDPLEIEENAVQAVIVLDEKVIAFLQEDRMKPGNALRRYDNAVGFVAPEKDLVVGEFDLEVFLFQSVANDLHFFLIRFVFFRGTEQVGKRCFRKMQMFYV